MVPETITHSESLTQIIGCRLMPVADDMNASNLESLNNSSPHCCHCVPRIGS
jgi:hypothetical protein